jgi:hypothetical protein
VPVYLVHSVEEELNKILKLGEIEGTDSSYASPLVIVKKKLSNDLRTFVSCKDLNAFTIIDPTPRPDKADMEDVLAKLGKSTYLSTFDVSRPKGFYATNWKKNLRIIPDLHTKMLITIFAFGLSDW